MTVRIPPGRTGVNRAARRLNGALKPGTATSNGGILYEVIPILGATRVTVRIKTATNGGNIDLIFAAPNFDPEQTLAFASLAGTLYTTGNPTQVPVTAGTEARIQATCEGESFLIVKFTGSVGAGTITYVDVSQVVA